MAFICKVCKSNVQLQSPAFVKTPNNKFRVNCINEQCVNFKETLITSPYRDMPDWVKFEPIQDSK